MRSVTVCASVVLTMIVAGCGGGGSGGSSGVSSPHVVFRITPPPTPPVVGLQFSVYLPAGVEVPLEAGTNRVQPSKLVAGSGVAGVQVHIYGTYSASARKIKIGVLAKDKQAFAKGLSGEIAALAYAGGSELKAADFKNANGAKPVVDVTGYRYDATSKQAVAVPAASVIPVVDLQ